MARSKLHISVVAGFVPENWALSAVEHWSKRISSLASVDIFSICGKNRKRANDVFISHLGKYPVAMTRSGNVLSTPEWADFLRKIKLSPAEVTFLIGDADGLSTGTISACRKKIALSPVTLQHDVALIVLLEQLYRSLSINSGLPYHRGE